MKLYLIGGFLGSGKTTAIKNGCAQLMKEKVNVGVITNDQGVQLVDTRFIRNTNVLVMEVTDGCFCCNYDKVDSLIEVLKETHHAEIVFAESVGSCTDMIATVVKPLQKFRKDIETVISVFVDANVLPTMLQAAPLFVDSVTYIYKKQIEEADILIVNKIDSLTDEELNKMERLVNNKFPEKTILFQNSLDKESINQWLITQENYKAGTRSSLEIDYDIYGAGEAELAWLDIELELFADENNAFEVGLELVKEIHCEIAEQKLPIGHLKFFLDDGVQQKKISYTAGSQNSITDIAKSASAKADILINARVQTEPEHLESLVINVISKIEARSGHKFIKKGISSFKPGYPKPTHRIID
jgi:G3E family GTPase